MPFPSATLFPGLALFPGDNPPVITTYTFTPPTVPWERPPGRLWRFYATEVSVSILKNGTAYTQVQFPDDEDLTAADVVYLGGHTYSISTDEANALYAAGYGNGVVDPTTGLPLDPTPPTPPDSDPPGYGEGGYGAGDYGL